MRQASLFTPQPTAVFSECTKHASCPDECKGRLYRYTLVWPASDTGKGRALFILANPSTATHLKPDPTVGRCISYASRWGYAECAIGNVRAYRSTDPKGVPPDPEGIGPDNDRYLWELMESSDLVVCGWGKLGGERGAHMVRRIFLNDKIAHALRLNEDGSPQHPLYLPRDAEPFQMVARVRMPGSPPPGPWLLRTVEDCDRECGRTPAFERLDAEEDGTRNRWYAFDTQEEADRAMGLVLLGERPNDVRGVVYDPRAETVPAWAGGAGKKPMV